jgi:hypothetical protein
MNANAKKRYKDIDLPFICPITGRQFNSTKGLSIYVTKTLKMDHKEYYNKYVHHRETKCFFCGKEGEFISIGKGYRNLCNDPECIKKSFSSHSIEGFMYREDLTTEEAEIRFKIESERQLNERMKTVNKLRIENPLYDKERSHNCVEFWIKRGFTEENAKIEVNKVMNNIHIKTSDKLKNNPLKYASKYPTKIEYYLERGFSEEEGRDEISKIQNRFSLDKCIKKYGEKDGTEIWLDRQAKWQDTLTKNGKLKCGYSEISQILFRDILNYCDVDQMKNIYFYTKNNEYSIRSEDHIFLYDFTDIINKKIIEYNGDQYHANPRIYDKDDTPHPYHKEKGFTAKDIWYKDKIKKELAESYGFEYFIVWDSDYKSNPEQTLKKCIEFLNNK